MLCILQMMKLLKNRSVHIYPQVSKDCHSFVAVWISLCCSRIKSGGEWSFAVSLNPSLPSPSPLFHRKFGLNVREKISPTLMRLFKDRKGGGQMQECYSPPLPPGGGTLQSVMQGRSILTEKVLHLCTFYWKKEPLSHTYLRTLHPSSKPLKWS